MRVKDGDGSVLEENVEKYDKIFMGEVPIMLRSSYCSLAERTNRELTTLGECPYDQASNPVLSAYKSSWPCSFSLPCQVQTLRLSAFLWYCLVSRLIQWNVLIRTPITMSRTVPSALRQSMISPQAKLILFFPIKPKLGSELHAAQGGYFIVNGSEKVLIAQERMASNHVAVYKKSQPSKYSHVAEMRRAALYVTSVAWFRPCITICCHFPAELSDVTGLTCATAGQLWHCVTFC